MLAPEWVDQPPFRIVSVEMETCGGREIIPPNSKKPLLCSSRTRFATSCASSVD